jgi:hypothetical protein
MGKIQTAELTDRADIRGHGTWVLTAEDGTVKARGLVVENKISDLGDRMYAERAVGVAGAPNAPTGMKLGNGASPSPTKTSTLGAYVATGRVTPTITAQVITPGRRIQYVGTFGPNIGTMTNVATPINEAAITNEGTLADVAPTGGAGGNTVAHIALTPVVGTKAATDTLTITWNHDLGSA